MRAPVLATILLTSAATAADPELATVLVYGPNGPGSGAVVQSDGKTSVVLTNRHVCPHGDREIRVRAAGRSYVAAWLGADAECDVAALRVPVALEPLKMADAEPAAGADVRLYGYGGFSKSGKVVGPDGSRFTGIGDTYFMTLRPQPGDSGSPVVNDKDEMVALAWGFQPRGGLAIRLADVKAAMGRLLAPRPVRAASPPPPPVIPPQAFVVPAENCKTKT
jgi:S1-C subfamily serine protease